MIQMIHLKTSLQFSLILLIVGHVYGQTSGSAADPTEMTIESLLTMHVTTASKFPEKLSGAPGVMSVVTQDELRRFGFMTVAEALGQVPGLQATAGFFAEPSMVAVRGDQVKENGSHVLILINGRPAREILDGGRISEFLRSFPVNALERIEVIRGPGSVLYGTNAFSGVINLITKKAHGRSATFRSFGAGRSGGGASGEVLLERGKLSIIAAGQARYQPHWGVRYSGLLDAQYTRSRSEDLAIRDQGPSAYVGLDYRGLRLMGTFAELQSTYFLPEATGESRSRRGLLNLGYTFAPTSRWEMSFDLTHSLHRLLASNYPSVNASSSDTVLEWTNVVRLSSKSQVTFGTLYDYIQGKALYYAVNPPIPLAEGSRHAPGFYAQIDHRLTSTLKLIAGFQSNKIGSLDLKTVPRAGLVWSPAEHVHVKALYGKAFRAPSLIETGLRTQPRVGNPSLISEQVGTFDLGISYQTDRFLVAANYFDSRQTGIIEAGSATYTNLDSIRIRGVEFESKWYLNDHLFAFGSLLYNKPDLARPLRTPRWTTSGGLSYQAKKAFIFSLSNLYSASVPGYAFTINPSPTAHHQIQTHGRLEMSRVFGQWAKGLALFVHGENLGGRQAWLPSLESSSNDTIPFRRGRTFYYGLEVALSRE